MKGQMDENGGVCRIRVWCFAFETSGVFVEGGGSTGGGDGGRGQQICVALHLLICAICSSCAICPICHLLSHLVSPSAINHRHLPCCDLPTGWKRRYAVPCLASRGAMGDGSESESSR